MNLLEDLYDKSENHEWLSENFESIFEEIATKLVNNATAQDSIKALNLVFPYAISRHDYERWQPLLMNALIHGQELRNNDIQIRIWEHIGQNYLKGGSYHRAYEAFLKAYERADEGKGNTERKLLARIGLLCTQAMRNNQSLRERIVHEILVLSHHVYDLNMLALVHRVLAVHHLYSLEIPQALEHGQYALAMFFRAGHDIDITQTAFILSEIYRLQKNIPMAKQLLHLGHVYLKGREHAHQMAHYAYQRGTLAHVERDHGNASYWLDIALSQFLEFGNYPAHKGAAHHTLGLTQVYLAEFDKARENLEEALHIWQELDNRYEYINALFAKGFLAQKEGKYRDAHHWYDEALKVCDQSEQSPRLQALRNQILKDKAEMAGDYSRTQEG